MIAELKSRPRLPDWLRIKLPTTESFSRTRDSLSELNQTWEATRMRQEKRRQLREIDSLLCGIEQNVRWSRERLAWRVANYAKRK